MYFEFSEQEKFVQKTPELTKPDVFATYVDLDLDL